MGATRCALRLRFWDPTTALVPLLTNLRSTLVVSPRSAIVLGCIVRRLDLLPLLCNPTGRIIAFGFLFGQPLANPVLTGEGTELPLASLRVAGVMTSLDQKLSSSTDWA